MSKQFKPRQLTIAEIGLILANLKYLPKYFNDLDKIDETEILARLPNMFGDAMPELIMIIAVACNATDDEIGKLLPGEFIELAGGVLKVNDIGAIVDDIKKLVARQTSQTETGTGEPSTSSPANTAGATEKLETYILAK